MTPKEALALPLDVPAPRPAVEVMRFAIQLDLWVRDWPLSHNIFNSLTWGNTCEMADLLAYFGYRRLAARFILAWTMRNATGHFDQNSRQYLADFLESTKVRWEDIVQERRNMTSHLERPRA